MTTTTTPASTSTSPKVTSPATTRSDGFTVIGSPKGLGYNLPQTMGRKLWLPMFALAFMGWTAGFVLAVVEAGTDRADTAALQTLSHLVPAFMFIGFLGVFAAISFAVARILGTFRKGGGDVQEAAGSTVQTLKMPTTAKAMLVFMMMGMMVMAVGIVVNLIGAAYGTSAADLLDSRSAAIAAAGLRRLGVVMYLSGIALGLATIIDVLRFQSTRIREIAAVRH